MGKNLKGKDIGKGICQRPDGRYEARAKINGVKIDMYDFDLAALKKQFDIAKFNALQKGLKLFNDITLEEWFDDWFVKCKAPQLKNEPSRNSYRRKAQNTIIRVLGDKKLVDITQMDIQIAANELLIGYKRRTVLEGLGVLRECLTVAAANGLINANPCVSIKVRDDNVLEERRVLSKREQEIFLKEIEKNYYEEALKILLITGMRIGEFSGLQWRDVDYESKCIHIRRSLATAYLKGKKIEELGPPKTSNSYRDIPFFDETEKLFRAWRKKQKEIKERLGDRWRANPELGDLVFTTTTGSPATRYVMATAINSIVSNINSKELTRALIEKRDPVLFDNLYPHAFRHTFATRCFDKNMDPVVVQAIMGHANYSTTISYTHVLEDRVKEESAEVGAFFEEKKLVSKNTRRC